MFTHPSEDKKILAPLRQQDRPQQHEFPHVDQIRSPNSPIVYVLEGRQIPSQYDYYCECAHAFGQYVILSGKAHMARASCRTFHSYNQQQIVHYC